MCEEKKKNQKKHAHIWKGDNSYLKQNNFIFLGSSDLNICF